MKCRAVALAIAMMVGACAPAVPSMVGGRTTPRDGAELGIGAATRVPLGDLAPPADRGTDLEALAVAGPGGVAPIGWARWGFARNWDLALLAAGPSLRLELRGALRVGALLRIITGVSAYGGYLWSEPREATFGGEAGRGGLLVPLALGIDAAGLGEIWIGVRAGFEHLEGTLRGDPMIAGSDASLHLTTFRAGPLVGLALGVRPVHVMIELAADIEHVRGARAESAIERTGVALVPALALRFRF